MPSDLCLLADLKARLKIQPSNTNADAELQNLISRCSLEFTRACNRTSFFVQAYTERRNGQGGRMMVLRNDPIVSVTSVNVGRLVIVQSPDGLQPGYVFDASTLYLVNYVFFPGYGNVQINYTAGFGPANGLALDDPSFPNDIEEAVLDWCATRYKIRQNEGMTGKRLATGESVSFSTEDTPKNVRAVIELYKRRVAVM
jgi:hypothetical protein